MNDFFGYQELLLGPESRREYTVRCLSTEGTLISINKNLLDAVFRKSGEKLEQMIDAFEAFVDERLFNKRSIKHSVKREQKLEQIEIQKQKLLRDYKAIKHKSRRNPEVPNPYQEQPDSQ